jgi:DNA-binding transcriptional MerR regulator
MQNTTTTQRRLSRRQLAAALGVRDSTIKFYSEAGLLPFHQAGEGLARRYDRDQAATRLKVIADLQELGLSIPAIQRRLNAASSTASA